ncbi:uncharacterized protein LOC134752952 [Cydia strobilella]|uniref:uncharacterized protein LOC134752952 n=1 Tax=Cydia strobilella TaxID=1100964 RepID=UPI003007755B
MLTSYLFVVGFGLVAANPILQMIKIPGQSYPSQACPTCPTQTCPSQTCPSQTCPTSRPPCQTCQTSYRNVYSQPTNNCPCNKQVTAQNPVANIINQDVLSQLVIRRLLSTPQPQTQVNPAPACTNCEAQKAPPNIINNYIVIPPEYFKANETKVDKEEPDTRTRKGKRRRKQSRRRNQENITCPCEDEKEKGKIIVEKQETSCPCDKYTYMVGGDEVKNGKIEDAPSLKTRTVNDKVLPESAPSSKNTKTSQNDKVVYNYHEVSGETELTDTKNTRNSNRDRKIHLEDAIIKDFCRKHPTIPEEIARSLLNKLKHQIDKKENPHYSPYRFSPYSYEHYDPELFYPRSYGYPRAYSDVVESDRRSRKRKQHRSGRRNKKQKEEVKENTDICNEQSEKLVEKNPTVINIETEIISTEKITASAEKVKENLTVNNSETQMETPDDLLDQLDKMKAKFAKLNEIETTTVSYNKRIGQYPELGKEDKVPTVYNNGVDDYYPDFRGDNIPFYASDEECDSKEDMYDKNGGFDSKRYVNHKQSSTNSRKDETSTEYPVSVSTESYDSYEETKDGSDEIRFIIPPHLELPDFETKQINKLEINDFVADDLNTYSDATAKQEIELKPAKVFTKDKSGRTNIETVYGRSRVVKYGHDAESAASEPVITYYLPEDAMTEDRIQLPDGEGIVVVAKSIRDLENWEI